MSALRFDSPVGTQAERDSDAFPPGQWFIATGYAQYYTALTNPAYHTGADLNLPNYADAGAPVYAAADGEVVFVGARSGWQGIMIVIRHPMTGAVDAPLGAVWSRSAHLKAPEVSIGDHVLRGELLGFIGDYAPAGSVNDHLHFDLARIDLGERPGDWPGMDKARLLRDYYDPRAFLLAHREETIPK